jgi:hypothetical protein
MSIIVRIPEIITRCHTDDVLYTRQKQVNKPKTNKTVNFVVDRKCHHLFTRRSNTKLRSVGTGNI